MDGLHFPIINPSLQRLFVYWDAKRAGGRLPGRADIDPLELGFILGNVLLVEVVGGDPIRFRIRVHGTNLAQRAGYELTGKMLDELPINQFRALARDSFTVVATSGEPFHSCRDRILDGKRHRYETMMLPLFDETGRVNMLLIGMVYL